MPNFDKSVIIASVTTAVAATALAAYLYQFYDLPTFVGLPLATAATKKRK